MLLVRRVSGPARARAGTLAVYRVTEFSESDPPAEEKARINWIVHSEGQAVFEKQAVGDTLEFEVPEELTGKTLRIMAFRNEPTPRVSVVTRIDPTAGRELGTEPPAVLLTPRIVKLEREGSRYYARIDDGPRFYVGTNVPYEGRRGLMNTQDLTGLPYEPEDYRGPFGFWADFIYPTALCESEGYFQRLNTYDRARFTFGFFQHAAHTPNDNFVLLLRQLLILPAAAAYFPDLTLIDEAVHQITDSGPVRLETETSTDELMRYLNPSGQVMDEVEVINAAKFIHWSLTDPEHRACQVAFTIDTMKKKMRQYARQYPLHGVVDTICMVVADIRHQGRAKSRSIIEALASGDALENLLSLGEDSYKARIRRLRQALEDGLDRGVFGKMQYDRTTEDFIPI
jgi:hypothetical protein